jgi:hypothetical protein
VWQLRKAGQVTNLSATVTPASLSIDLNFHTDAADTNAARAALKDRAVAHLATARAMIENTFDLTEENT